MKHYAHGLPCRFVKFSWLVLLALALAPPCLIDDTSAQEEADARYEDRTDTVHEKLRLLESAYAAQHFDLAMSLVESIKDTLSFERQVQAEVGHPDIGADHFARVDEFPEAWAHWSRGWAFCKPLTLSETVGIARSNEPVDMLIGFNDEQTDNLHREVRVVRLDQKHGELQEVSSQIYSEVYRDGQRYCRLIFLADVPAHGQAHYFVFYGNPNAELPQYTTDLKVTGEGYGLDVENDHFVARLSRQMGQLERLTYKREHGLELYAGGKGHGEPPGIDWAHDYVDVGHFQKLRMRNWSQCPNYEVVRGPICVRVRRWGFPHSPIHPLFTPSRMHMDQTYVFYAGHPYFIKEGRFDMIKDFVVEAMRDDEWVLSGYSFTNTVWIDRDGILHEGRVSGDHGADLWGVGFYHRDSRDGFIALWLDHSAENYDGILHGGAPTLNYDGHGQLWSRYPANHAQFKTGASIHQRNAYIVLPYPKQDAAKQIQRMRSQLLNPLVVRPEQRPQVSGVTRPSGSLAREGETSDTAGVKPAIWRTLREVRDDQLYNANANVVDMGYVYDVSVRDGTVRVLVTMPHRGRPVYQFLVTKGGGRVGEGIYERLMRIKGVRRVVVDFTWEPPWTVARLTDEGRRAMGLAD